MNVFYKFVLILAFVVGGRALADSIYPPPPPAGLFTTTGALKGNGSGAISQAACADLSNGAAGCSATLPLSVANGGTGDSGTAWTSFTATATCGTGTVTTATYPGFYKQLGKTLFLNATFNVTTIGTCINNYTFTLPNSLVSVANTPLSAYNSVGVVVASSVSASGTSVFVNGVPTNLNYITVSGVIQTQ